MPNPNKKRAQEIVTMWNTSSKKGLGSKRFAPEVRKKFEPRFQKKVLAKLDKGDKFGPIEERQTKIVARDVGKVCTMLTRDAEVSLDVFEDVFRLLKKHMACPASTKVGAGAWCDVPLG